MQQLQNDWGLIGFENRRGSSARQYNIKIVAMLVNYLLKKVLPSVSDWFAGYVVDSNLLRPAGIGFCSH